MMKNIPTPKEIKDRAEAIGLSYVSLCKEAGVAPSTFNRWLNGKTDPIKVYRQIIETLKKREAG